MGNAHNSVTSGVKDQANSGSRELYKLVNLSGGGELIELMKTALRSRDFTAVDQAIAEKVPKFLYNNGEGKILPIAEVTAKRHMERGTKLIKERKQKRNEVASSACNGEATQNCETKYDANGSVTSTPASERFKEVCWDLNERGAVGETILHVCFLNGSTAASELAKRLISRFPKMINDVYISDEYYGENVLHMAIVNEDPAMVKYLLQCGVNVHQRCCGNFFTPDDQKMSRSDSPDHEWVDLCLQTSYQGRTYWGEYPLSFAAFLNQEECLRLLVAKKANPNMQDANGNTILHMMVIHKNKEMFDLALQLGASPHVKNRQGLVPLTLAAKMANEEMFAHVLNTDREEFWTYAEVTCAAYPLQYADSIMPESGQINRKSALALVVYGDKPDHLQLLDGVLENLLALKWKTFAKKRLYVQFAAFIVYFTMFFAAFLIRPTSLEFKPATNATTEPIPAAPENSSSVVNLSLNSSNLSPNASNGTTFYPTTAAATRVLLLIKATEATNQILVASLRIASELNLINSTTTTPQNFTAAPSYAEINTTHQPELKTNNTELATTPQQLELLQPQTITHRPACYLLQAGTRTNQVRLLLELLILLSAIYYIGSMAIDMFKHVGYKLYLESMRGFPARVSFVISCVLTILMLPLRIGCWHSIEDIVCIINASMLTLHFLFFSRGFKIIGPFVLMVYKMIAGDLLRFFIIYMILVMGFLQSFYIIFLRYKPKEGEDYEYSKDNLFRNFQESFNRMFLLSLGESDVFHEQLNQCALAGIGKVLYVIYMMLVGVLLINTLIAMMAKTYELISETKKEWLRQWAAIILMMEQSMNPEERLKALMQYSRPLAGDKSKRALVVHWRHTEKEREETLDKRAEQRKEFEAKRASYYAMHREGSMLSHRGSTQDAASIAAQFLNGSIPNGTSPAKTPRRA